MFSALAERSQRACIAGLTDFRESHREIWEDVVAALPRDLPFLLDNALASVYYV